MPQEHAMMRRLMLVLVLGVALVACDRRQPVAQAPATAATAPPDSAAAAAPTTAPATATSPAAAAPPTPAGVAEPSGAEALQHVRVLAGQIGPRVAGSPEERRAADYIAGLLRRYGYEVELQSFPIEVFVSRSVSVQVVAPVQESVRAGALTGSAPGTATADLFDAGLGQPGDYPAGGIGGRIALVQRGQITFGEKARNAHAASAAAVVMYDPAGDIIPGRLTGQVPPIPVLSIPGPDGLRLRDLLKQGPVRLSVSFDGGTEQTTALNVIGRSPGKRCGAVVGGHYDTVPGAPGGSDNASGTAAMLEAARVQALRGNPEDACFIAFSAEELGLLGSQAFLERLPTEDRQAIRFMINLDMVAVGHSWWLIGSRTLTDRARAIAAALGVAAEPHELVGASSDHASFLDRRIPAVMLHRWNDTLLHTPEDTADRVQPEALQTAVRLTIAFLAGLGTG
jgi:aminopeptidase YwaD